ncbi:hypothetical protein PTKIN_Ptkin18bG0045300 [Pterospermum kingtungense]
MLVVGLVEAYRQNLAFSSPTLGIAPKEGQVSSMSAKWLVLQLFLSRIYQCFNCIGQIEFHHEQFLKNIRSIVSSFFFLRIAGYSWLNGFLVSFVYYTTSRVEGGDWLPEDLNKGKLNYFYFLIAALSRLLEFVMQGSDLPNNVVFPDPLIYPSYPTFPLVNNGKDVVVKDADDEDNDG